MVVGAAEVAAVLLFDFPGADDAAEAVPVLPSPVVAAAKAAAGAVAVLLT